MKQAGVALVLGVVALLALVVLLGWTAPGQDELRAEKAAIAEHHARELAPLNLALGRVVRVSAIIVVGSIAAIFASGGVTALASIPAFVRKLRIWSWLIRAARNALYPASAAPDGQGHFQVRDAPNERLSQPIAAMTNGKVDRLGGAGQVVKQLTNPKDPDFALTQPEELPIYRPEDSIQPDIRNRPDTLLVGAKGSGKTSALRWMIECYMRAIPDAEFIICSPIGSNWNIDGVISDPIQIRDTILELAKEMDRRDQVLKDAGITDYHKWTDRPRPLVVVIDEAEATVEQIELAISVREAKNFGRTLRIVVNKARNFGFAIIQATQSARADVLDSSFMHQAGTLIMMRMDAATAARFNEYDEKIVEQLPRLPAGRAYSPQVNGYIQFPETSELRRQPRMSRVYQPKPKELARPDEMLQLPADAEADGIGADDLPDTHGEYATTGRATVAAERGVNGGGNGYGRATVVAATVASLSMEERVKRIPRNHVPMREDEQETIYAMWESLARNSAATQRAIYDYAGGTANYYCAFAINRALARRGQPPMYKEQER